MMKIKSFVSLTLIASGIVAPITAQAQNYPYAPYRPYQTVGEYQNVGGVWVDPNGQPVPVDRRRGEDTAACVDRISFLTLFATSRSESHGNYRYKRPGNVTPKQMIDAGLSDHDGFFSEKWRGSAPRVVIRTVTPQEAAIRCR